MNESPLAPDIVAQLSAQNEFFFSFEYFPPKTEKGLENLKRRLHHMASWGCRWMDVTWGAGGSTSDLTPQICSYIQNEVGMTCMMHLTCTNMPKEKIDVALRIAKECNIRNILALRGDPPHGESNWKAIDTGFACALDLVKYIKAQHGDYFAITVAGYPEGHPNVRHKIENVDARSSYWAIRRLENGDLEGVSPQDWETELDYLKQKQDAGAQVIVTQLFYDVDIFLGFIEQARARGITIPIIPGIMPIRNASSFGKMTGFCRTVIPDELAAGLASRQENAEEYKRFGMEWVINMCKRLRRENVAPSLHIYTMNTSLTSGMILRALNLSDAQPEPKSAKKKPSRATGQPTATPSDEQKEDVTVSQNHVQSDLKRTSAASGDSVSEWLWLGVVICAILAVGVSVYQANKKDGDE